MGARLVLLVLADAAGPDGTDAYPSVATIAHHARLSERAVQYALRSLEADGLIEHVGPSPYGTRNYTVKTDLGKLDELPPLNSNSPLSKSLKVPMDGSGASDDRNRVSDCTPVQNLHPPLRVVENG